MLKLCKHFNPHSRVGNDARLSHGVQSISSDFNPRSRVGNDADLSVLRLADAISIHVPSWGTTVMSNIFAVLFDISIHVPSWGTTYNDTVYGDYTVISIHVPSWGTTANFHKYSLLFYAINIILIFVVRTLPIFYVYF